MEEREGLFGKEQIAVKKEIYTLYEEEGMAVIPGGEIRNNQGKLLQFISQSVWPLKDGEAVVVVKNLENTSDIAGVRKQVWILACLIVMLPVGVWIMVKSSRKLFRFQVGDWKQGMKGIALFTVSLVTLFLLLGKLDIPRKFLPPEYILDIGFYMNEFFFWI